jgi:uncharacterized protein (DUF4415 family)
MASSSKPDPYMIDFETAPLTEEEIKRLRPAREVFAELGLPLPSGPGRPVSGLGKQQVTLRLDNEIIEFFKADGPGWQTRLNAELASVVRQRKKAS